MAVQQKECKSGLAGRKRKGCSLQCVDEGLIGNQGLKYPYPGPVALDGAISDAELGFGAWLESGGLERMETEATVAREQERAAKRLRRQQSRVLPYPYATHPLAFNSFHAPPPPFTAMPGGHLTLPPKGESMMGQEQPLAPERSPMAYPNSMPPRGTPPHGLLSYGMPLPYGMPTPHGTSAPSGMPAQGPVRPSKKKRHASLAQQQPALYWDQQTALFNHMAYPMGGPAMMPQQQHQQQHMAPDDDGPQHLTNEVFSNNLPGVMCLSSMMFDLLGPEGYKGQQPEGTMMRPEQQQQGTGGNGGAGEGAGQQGEGVAQGEPSTPAQGAAAAPQGEPGVGSTHSMSGSPCSTRVDSEVSGASLGEILDELFREEMMGGTADREHMIMA